MNRHLNLSIIFFSFYFLFSCEKKSEFPDLNVDPLVSAYKKNEIDFYIILKKWKDTIVERDSVVVNKNGYITDRIAWTKEHFKYDSINRIIEHKLDSDIHFLNKMNYRLDNNNHEVLQIINNGQITYHFKYDDKFKRLKNKYFLDENLDTLVSTIYKYANDKIILIKENHPTEKWSTKIEFIYDKNQKLRIIKNGVYGETQYISNRTGLIDSASNNTDRIYYIYHKRK